MNTKSNTDETFEHILKRLGSDIQTKLFGSYNASSSSGNDVIKKRKATLISHGNEALRILKSKRAQIGNKESPYIRAALVIEYLARNVRNNDYFPTSIQTATLLDIIGSKKKIKKKDLEQMQRLLEAYLDKTAIHVKITTRPDRGGSSSGTLNAKSARSLRKRNVDGSAAVASSSNNQSTEASSAAELAPTGLIQELCIKLGPLIPDSDFVLKYTTRLFDALVTNVSRSSSNNNKDKNSNRQRERDWLRKDMVRYLECYEAACFYLAVKESEGANYNEVLKKKASAKISMKNQQKKNNDVGGGRKREVGVKNNNHNNNNNKGDDNENSDGDEDDDDTDDDRPMNEMDVVMAACLSESTFKTVLDHVRKYAQDIVISLDDTTDNQKKASAKRKKTSNADKKGTAVSNGYGGRSVIVERSISSRNSSRFQSTNSKKKNNVEFEQWKQSILDATVAKMQQNHMNESRDNTNITREEALKYAAEEVVRDLHKKNRISQSNK